MAVNQAEEVTGTDDLRYPPNASLIVSHHLSTYPLGCHLIIDYHHYPLLLNSPNDMAFMNHHPSLLLYLLTHHTPAST